AEIPAMRDSQSRRYAGRRRSCRVRLEVRMTKFKIQNSKFKIDRASSHSKFCILHFAFFILLLSCRTTVGVSRMPGGYAEVAPTVANEMIVDSSQIVVIDVRSPEAFNG